MLPLRSFFKTLTRGVRVAVYLNGTKQYQSVEDQSQHQLELTLEGKTNLIWLVIPVKKSVAFNFRVIITANGEEMVNRETTTAAGQNCIQSCVLIPEPVAE